MKQKKRKKGTSGNKKIGKRQIVLLAIMFLIILISILIIKNPIVNSSVSQPIKAIKSVEKTAQIEKSNASIPLEILGDDEFGADENPKFKIKCKRCWKNRGGKNEF